VTVKATSKGKASNKQYYFDHVFGPSSTQQDVYNTAVEPLVDDVLGGFNGTVFAYGQTGTGKTHTVINITIPTFTIRIHHYVALR
jgi:DNA replication protein DnaC